MTESEEFRITKLYRLVPHRLKPVLELVLMKIRDRSGMEIPHMIIY